MVTNERRWWDGEARETKNGLVGAAGILSATYHFAVIIPDRGAQSATRAGNTCDGTVTILNRPIERKPGQLTEMTFETARTVSLRE